MRARYMLGINNCFAVKRFVKPEEWMKIVREVLELDIVQFSLDLLDPLLYSRSGRYEAYKVRANSEEYEVKIDTCFTGLAAYSFNLLGHPDPYVRADGLEWHLKAIELTTIMGARGYGGHISALTMQDYEDRNRRKKMLERVIEGVKVLRRKSEEEGHEFLLWEPMPIAREPPHTIKEAEEILERANEGRGVPLKYCVDLGHTCAKDVRRREDRDPYEWLRRLARDIPVLHVQQTDGKGDRHWPFTEKYNRRGIIKPDKVLEALDEGGSKGTVLVFEIIHAFEESEKRVVDDLEETVRYWKEYL
ncbi:MAG TPA: sugar phosphate isomerase/epimerase [Candidatus Bathyarchaeota archaeon]|nr:sugar phosphate isomerase/epimerase [Candidatus Bathyarchaeota archaeon]